MPKEIERHRNRLTDTTDDNWEIYNFILGKNLE